MFGGFVGVVVMPMMFVAKDADRKIVERRPKLKPPLREVRWLSEEAGNEFESFERRMNADRKAYRKRVGLD